jgi:hypothetical protein
MPAFAMESKHAVTISAYHCSKKIVDEPHSMTIEYFEVPEMPGKRMFTCTAMRASLRVDACKEMWAKANAKDAPERLHKCKQCPIGAMHVGVVDQAMNRVRGSATCSRCHRTDMRLIGGNICVCCKNREYEWVKGKNGRGKFPVTHPMLNKRVVRYVVAGEVRVLTRVLTASMDELTVELLRDCDKRVVFGLGRGRVVQRQGSLL